jgi:hypothetical protein
MSYTWLLLSLQHLVMMKSLLVTASALLVLVLLTTTSAAANTPRRALLDAHSDCLDKCTNEYNKNVEKCIAETQLGEPPAIKSFGAASGNVSTAYVPPDKTAFELTKKRCRELQDPEFTKCKSNCEEKKPEEKKSEKGCEEVSKQCDENFKKGTLLAAWCRTSKGC